MEIPWAVVGVSRPPGSVIVMSAGFLTFGSRLPGHSPCVGTLSTQVRPWDPAADGVSRRLCGHRGVGEWPGTQIMCWVDATLRNS